MKKLSPYITGMVLFLIPLISLGAASSTLQNAGDVITLIENIGLWMFRALIGVAVVFILVAAYNFMFSGGSEENVEKAKKQLLFTLVAVGVALLSKGLISFLETILTKTT